MSKRARITLGISPDSAYQVFGNHDLRPMIFNLLPLVSIISVMKAFPLLNTRFNLHKYVWDKFVDFVLVPSGFRDTYWMKQDTMGFVAGNFVKLLLTEPCDYEQLIVKPKVVAVLCNLEINKPFLHGSFGADRIADRDFMDVFSLLTKFGIHTQGLTNCDTNHFKTVYCCNSYKKYILCNLGPKIEFHKSRCKTIDEYVSNTTEEGANYGFISPCRLKILNLESLLHKTKVFRIDEIFIRDYDYYARPCTNICDRIVKQKHNYRDMGFTVFIERLCNTKEELMMVIGMAILGRLNNNNTALHSHQEEVSKATEAIYKWVYKIAPAIK